MEAPKIPGQNDENKKKEAVRRKTNDLPVVVFNTGFILTIQLVIIIVFCK